MSPFAGYLLGLLVLVGGLAVAAFLLNVPTGAVVVAVILLLAVIGAWATRPPRARPSKFTGATPNAPSLDRSVLTELKTAVMERIDAARAQRTMGMPQADASRTQPTTRMPQADASRTQPTTRMPQADASRSQPTTRIDRQTGVSKPPRPTPPED